MDKVRTGLEAAVFLNNRQRKLLNPAFIVILTALNLTEKLVKKLTCSYIHKMQVFVIAINSRTNRVTNLAPNKVTKADLPRLVSLRAEQSLKLVRRPKQYIGGYVARVTKICSPMKF